MVKIGTKSESLIKLATRSETMGNLIESPETAQIISGIKKSRQYMSSPSKEELRGISWCVAQAFSVYKKNFSLNPKPTPTALIFIDVYKYLNKSKDPAVRKYLGLLDVKFEGIDLEEY